MAHDLTDGYVYTEDGVTVPDDGDDANAASVEVGFQDLADRTSYLAARVGFSGGAFSQPMSYGSTVAVRRYAPAGSATRLEEIGGASDRYWATRGDFLYPVAYNASPRDYANLTLITNRFDVIDSINVWVSTATNRTTAGDRFQFKLWSVVHDDSSPYSASTFTQIGTTFDDGGGTGYRRVTMTISGGHTVSGDNRYYLEITAPVSGTPGNDYVEAACINVNAFGPRI